MTWDESTHAIVSRKDGTEIRMAIGNDTMYVNGTAKVLDSLPTIINGRTLVPLRAISEAFLCESELGCNNKNCICNRE